MELKILFISHNFSPFIGGIEVISEVLANSFVRKGHKVHLLTWSKDNSGKTYPYKVIRDPNVITLFKEHRWADVVFENNPCLRLSWPRLFFRKPSVISLQTWVSRINGSISLKDKIKLKWLKKANKVISCSTAIRNRCFPESVVIQNPYRENIFHIKPEISRDKEFIFLGRMVSDKGAELAIKAFSKFFHDKKNSPDLKLTMVGDGPERKYLEKLVDNFKLNNSVKFTGPLCGEQLVSCLNEHKFLLVPSVWEEPFGVVVLEGMACGCIPIVSDGGGLPEAIGNGGLIFKRGNLDHLYDCMQNVIGNRLLQEQYRSQAENHLMRHRSSIIAQKYIEVIEYTFKNYQLTNFQEISI